MTAYKRATLRRAWRADWKHYRVAPTDHSRPPRKVRRQAWRDSWAEEFKAGRE